MIGGFTAPRGSREEFGALLVGHFDADGALRYAGKVGTGFDRATLQGPRRAAARAAPATTPRSPTRPRYRDATWVEPELVAQLGFAEWTTAGRLRHPRFLGLRFDKAAADVVREALNAEARLEAGFGHQKIRQVWAGDIVTRSQPSGRLRCLTSPVSAGGRQVLTSRLKRASAAGQLDG